MPDTRTGDSVAARQCWECFKRRLVCDRTLPLCRKCAKTGKECPGYNDQKPLQWVEPGHVTIRPKKKSKECRPPTSAIRTANSARLAPAIPNGPVADPGESRDASLPELLGQGGRSGLVSEELQLTPEAIELSKSQLANLLVEEDKPAWWRDLDIEKQVDPIELTTAKAGAGCGVGERIMCIGNKDQIKEVVERGQHWEAALLLQSNQRPLAKIQRLLQIMEMNRLPSYDFLSDETHDVVQAVNYYVDWRSHADGMKRLIDMRGGFASLRRTVPHMTSALVIFVLIVTFSNSLGPATHQISITEPLEQHIQEVEKVYSLILPYTLCPSTLFIEIIRINRLRQELSLTPIVESHQHAQDARSILSRVESYGPREWAQSRDQEDDWQLIASIWQSAIALYCIMSLQAVEILPSTTGMDIMRMRHRDRLLNDLKAATRLKQLKKISTFPLCVLGVEAGYHVQQSTQIWIERHLEDHARLLGSNSPLKAREVLRRYWRRKKPGWNECFNEPFTTLVPAGVC
ncbi:hypothetical protein J4E83_010878 [Alternaria metachromatica]|uniref:uncharacterized protein n=1 Tax=Alternaria metachromatica TaxID=283354 RepID=UPI0020C38A85|nr:uncharacterized protein J4E83_010878 [Alternaria metachromatica]KAI4605007.1 hypothetical protein J4E83_010878 [Alternaria metachromatica]